MADLYELNLWNKVDYLHERYQREYTHITNFLDMLTRFQTSCSDFSKSISAIIGKNYILSESSSSTIYQAMENFYKLLFKYEESFKETAESIRINSIPVIKSISDSYQKERDMYNIYNKHRTTLLTNKVNLKKIQKEFAQKARECESRVYDAKKASMYPTELPEIISKIEKMASESLANTAIIEDKYIQTLNETNKSRETEINTQKQMLSFYHNVDIDYYEKEKMMTGFFISCLRRMHNVINDEITDFNGKYKNINIEKDINEFVRINKVDDKPDDIIKFVPFKPVTEISDESILNADVTNKSKDGRILEVSLEVILVFKKFFKFIRTDLDMEKERKKSKLRMISYKLFWPGDNVYLEEDEKKELYSLFKEKNFTTFFLQILSRQRIKGYKKNKKVLEDLIEIFKYILDKAEKEKNLDEGINCVILSQTYFCEEKGNKGEIVKKYILDGIRDNKWLSSYEFWENVINHMIQKEIKKNEEINKNKNDIDKKINNNNIFFSQIFSYTNNMVEFNINKEGVQPFVENICKKYELDNDMVNAIEMNINKKFEEKEVLLKREQKEEYIMMNDMNENNNEIKENNEQNKKEIKEEPKKEEKKDEPKKEEDKKEELNNQEVKKEDNN
jgi:hypothetical protein